LDGRYIIGRESPYAAKEKPAFGEPDARSLVWPYSTARSERHAPAAEAILGCCHFDANAKPLPHGG